MTLLSKKVLSSHGKKIFGDIQTFNFYSLLSELCVKTKRSEFFAANNDIQNQFFENYSQKRKETSEIKYLRLQLHILQLFSFVSFKSILMQICRPKCFCNYFPLKFVFF